MISSPTHRVTPPGASNKGITAGRTPGDIAREAIPLLEKALFDTFRLKAKMGAELEFTVKDPAFAIESLERSLSSHLPSSQVSAKDKILMFEESTIISSFYKEVQSDEPNHLFKYEVVFSHRAEKNGCYLAEAITRIKQKLSGQEPLYDPEFNPAPDPVPKHSVSDYWSSASFQPFVPVPRREGSDVKGMTNGLHINMSLWDTTENRNIFTLYTPFVSGERKMRNFRDATMHKAVWDVFQSCALAIAPTQDAWQRYRARRFTSSEVNMFDPKKGPYIENKLPGADSDPYVAVMLNLTALYVGMKRLREGALTMPGNSEEEDLQGPTGFKKARDSFMRETLVKETLNDLRPGLGGAFHNAVLAQIGKSQGQSAAG